MSRRRIALAAGLALGLSAGVAPAAPAATPFGPVAGPTGCLAQGGQNASDTGTQGCATSAGLTGANGPVVSPDGRNVYVAGGTNAYGAVEVLRRDPATGALTQSGCLSSDGTDGSDGAAGACTATTPLVGAAGAATSPDGSTVYVASGGSGAVLAFRRAVDGTLTRQGCFQEAVPLGSNCTAGHVFRGAGSMAATPDGQALFVASGGRSAISAFTSSQVTGPGGQPSPSVAAIFGAVPPGPAFSNPCIATGALDGACANGNALSGVSAVALSPDGHHLYARAQNSHAIDTFTFDALGSLTQVGCLKSGSVPPGPCRQSRLLGGAGSSGAIAVSPDGHNLYVVDQSTLVVLNIAPDGAALTDGACFTEQVKPSSDNSNSSRVHAAQDQCQTVSGLDEPTAVAVTPDGATVVTVDNAGAVATFSRDSASGALTWVGCAGSNPDIDGADDSSCASAPQVQLVQGAALSPDGHDLYVAASGSNALLTYAPGATVATGRAVAARDGVVGLRVTCPAAAPTACRGGLRLGRPSRAERVGTLFSETRSTDREVRSVSARTAVRRAPASGVSGQSAFQVAPGRSAIVRVRLSAAVRARVRGRSALHLLAATTPDPGYGGAVARTVVVTVGD